MVNSSGSPSKSPTPSGVRNSNPVPPVRKNHQMMNGTMKKGQNVNNKGQLNPSQRPQTKMNSSNRPSSPAPQPPVSENVVQAQESTSKLGPKQSSPASSQVKTAVVEAQQKPTAPQNHPALKTAQPYLSEQQSKPPQQIQEKQGELSVQQVHIPQQRPNLPQQVTQLSQPQGNSPQQKIMQSPQSQVNPPNQVKQSSQQVNPPQQVKQSPQQVNPPQQVTQSSQPQVNSLQQKIVQSPQSQVNPPQQVKQSPQQVNPPQQVKQSPQVNPPQQVAQPVQQQANSIQQQTSHQGQNVHPNPQTDVQTQPQSSLQQTPIQSNQMKPGPQHQPQGPSEEKQIQISNSNSQQKRSSSQQRSEQNNVPPITPQVQQLPRAVVAPKPQANMDTLSGHLPSQMQMPQQYQQAKTSPELNQHQQTSSGQLPQQAQITTRSQSRENLIIHPTAKPNSSNDTNDSTPSLTPTQQSPLQSPEIFLQPSEVQQQILQRQRQLRPAPKPCINGIVLDQSVEANNNKSETNLNPFLKQQMVKSPTSGRRVVLVRKVKQQPNQSLSEEGSVPDSSAPSVPGFLAGAGGLRKRSFGGFQPRDQAKQILGQHINRRLSQNQVPGGASQPNLTTSQGDLVEPHSQDELCNNLMTMADFSVSTPENLAGVYEAFPKTLANTQSTQRKQTTSQLSLPSQNLLVSPSTSTSPTSVTTPTSNTFQASRPRRFPPQCENFSSSLDQVAVPAEAITEVVNSAAIGQVNPLKVTGRQSSADEINSGPETSVLKCDAVRSQVFSPQCKKNKSIGQVGPSLGRIPEPPISKLASNIVGEKISSVDTPSTEKIDGNAPDREIISSAKTDGREVKGELAATAPPAVERGDKNQILASTEAPSTNEAGTRNTILPASSVEADKRMTVTEEEISQLQGADAVPSLSEHNHNEDITADKTNGKLASEPSRCFAAADKRGAAEAGKEVADKNDGVSVKQKRFNEMKSYKIGEKCRLQVEARAEAQLKEQSAAAVDEQSSASSRTEESGKQQQTRTSSGLKNDCLDRNNNDDIEEMFRKMYGKELAAIQAKYESEVEALRKSLARKEEELTTSRSQATEAAEALARSREEQLKIKAQLTKEKEEIEEKHRKEREREERERREREEKERKEAEERRKKEDEEEAERKRKEQDVQKKSSESEGTEDGEDDEEGGGGEEEKETEAESNKRKIEKMHMEMLLLKQQNEEFEEMVREKYRRQVELELQIGEINNEVTQKEAAIQSVRVELSYAKNETALTQAKVKQLEEELLEQKQRVEALEKELDTAERELKRMEILQEKLRVTEGRRNELQAHIDEIELERDEEIKIIQDALDEAAQEREELLATFEKEIEKLNSLNAARETQMLQEFEDKLKELEQQHKSKLEEKDREAKTALQRSKRMADEEDVRQRLERLKSDLNSEWEDKLRSECARLKSELDSLHSEEKHLAVESIRVQKEQELQEVRKGVDGKVETLNKEISELKKSLAAKDEFYQQEIDEIRTRADRDVWELRRKLQKLDEASYDRQQLLEDKHREDLERLREEYADKMAGLEAQLSCVDVRGLTDLRAKLEAVHKQQMEHLGEQHRLSMERLRDELEAEKVQAAEEARVIVSRHHEYINESLKEQLAEAVTANTQYREEIEAIKFALCRREEVIKSLEEDLAKLKASKGGSPSAGSPPPTAGGQASPTAFQFPHEGSQGSRSSQDRLSNDADDDGHKGSGLLGKMFGGGWFSGTRARDSTTPANSPLSTGSSKKNRQST